MTNFCWKPFLPGLWRIFFAIFRKTIGSMVNTSNPSSPSDVFVEWVGRQIYWVHTVIQFFSHIKVTAVFLLSPHRARQHYRIPSLHPPRLKRKAAILKTVITATLLFTSYFYICLGFPRGLSRLKYCTVVHVFPSKHFVLLAPPMPTSSPWYL